MTCSGETKSCSAVWKGNTTSWCLFMPTSLGLKEGLPCSPAHMAGPDHGTQTDCSQAVSNVPRNVCCPEGKRSRWAPLISSPSVSMLDLLCVWLEHLPKNRLTGWHLNVPESFKWAYLSVSSKNSVVGEWMEREATCPRRILHHCAFVRASLTPNCWQIQWFLIGSQVFTFSTCCYDSRESLNPVSYVYQRGTGFEQGTELMLGTTEGSFWWHTVVLNFHGAKNVQIFKSASGVWNKAISNYLVSDTLKTSRSVFWWRSQKLRLFIFF